MANRLEKIEEVTAARTKDPQKMTPEGREAALRRAWREMRAKYAGDKNRGGCGIEDELPQDLVKRAREGTLGVYDWRGIARLVFAEWVLANQERGPRVGYDSAFPRTHSRLLI